VHQALACLVLAVSFASLPVPWRDAPKLAFDTRTSGTVVVEALVDSTGAIAAAGIARSIPLLDDSAIQRVRGMRFEPLVESGHRVASLRQLPVEFEPPPDSGPADTWSAEHCAEATFSVDVDVRPDSAGRFEARWNAKGLKSQELYVIV
jgi:TonB family protein